MWSVAGSPLNRYTLVLTFVMIVWSACIFQHDHCLTRYWCSSILFCIIGHIELVVLFISISSGSFLVVFACSMLGYKGLHIHCSSWCLLVSVGRNGMVWGINGMDSLHGHVLLAISLVTSFELRWEVWAGISGDNKADSDK